MAEYKTILIIMRYESHTHAHAMSFSSLSHLDLLLEENKHDKTYSSSVKIIFIVFDKLFLLCFIMATMKTKKKYYTTECMFMFFIIRIN